MRTAYYCAGCPAKCTCEVEECAVAPNGQHEPGHCLYNESYIHWVKECDRAEAEKRYQTFLGDKR